jgi:hypothetical protein
MFSKETQGHQKLLRYIVEQEENSEENFTHRISLCVNVQFTRNATGLPVHSTREKGAAIHIDSEEKFQKNILGLTRIIYCLS